MMFNFDMVMSSNCVVLDQYLTNSQFTILSPKGHDYLAQPNFHNSQVGRFCKISR